MISVVLNGILSGLLLSFLIGPVFFVLIETSLVKGFKQAFFIDIGVLLSDILYLIAAYYFAQEILEKLQGNYFIKYIAAAVFIGMGIYSIVKKTSPQKGRAINVDDLDKPSEVDTMIFRKRTALTLILKGIGLNVINPGVLVYWIAACTAATNELKIQDDNLIYYFTATLATMFGIDMIKIYFAGKLKQKMTPSIISKISMIVGIVFIVFGVIVMFKNI